MKSEERSVFVDLLKNNASALEWSLGDGIDTYTATIGDYNINVVVRDREKCTGEIVICKTVGEDIERRVIRPTDGYNLPEIIKNVSKTYTEQREDAFFGGINDLIVDKINGKK